MPSKSKNKGNTLEREMRDVLNATYETEEFARTPSSGAIMGLSNYKKNQGLSASTRTILGSDLICPDWFKFSVECKWYADKPNYAQIIKGADTDLDGWLAEACFDARNLELNPLLFFKTNRKGVHAALPAFFWPRLQMTCHLRYYEFLIIGIDDFVNNAEVIKDEGETSIRQTLEWLDRSEWVNQAICTMQTKKGKKR